MNRALFGTGAVGLGVTIASTFAGSLGLSLQQQRIGFITGMALVLIGFLLFFYGRKPGSPPEAALPTASPPAPAGSATPSSTRTYGHRAIGQGIREMFERAERRKRDLVEAEFVAMIDEGGDLQGNAFSSNLQWGDFIAWRDPIAEFLGTVFGGTQRQQILETGIDQRDIRSRIEDVLNWLRDRRDHPEAWEAQLAGIEGADLEAAIKARRDGLPLAAWIDNMIREGRELVTELSVPVQPERGNGVSRIDGGEPSPERQAKADPFRQRAVDLLEARNPALLVDYRDGCNDYIRRPREPDESGDLSAEGRSNAEKMLALANAERRTAAWEVEVCLEGLARARKAI